jgi:DMSO/TMAO reductase YedYZ molybdopterin-dependent catalytic subunit
MAFDLTTLVGRYTEVVDFYIRNHAVTPQKFGGPFLRVEGEVTRPRHLTPEDLAHLKESQLRALLECAGNPVATMGMVSNGMWEGWPLGKVLEQAAPSGAAAFLHLFGRDGWARSIPIDEARDAMLVTHLNGRPLQPNHGTPWRAVFPGRYGVDSVKWLERIVVSKIPLPSNGTSASYPLTRPDDYLELRTTASGEPDRQPLRRVQVKSVIVYPTSQGVVHCGSIQIRGLAWSGEGSIFKVEISSDSGAHWRSATLDPGSRYEWVLWQASLEISQPGVLELVCRATDVRGYTQPEQRGTGRLDDYENNWYHRVRVIVV